MKAVICFVAFSLALLQFCNGQGGGDQREQRLQGSSSPGAEENLPPDADGGSGPPGGASQSDGQPAGNQRHFVGTGVQLSHQQSFFCKEYLGWKPQTNEICPTRRPNHPYFKGDCQTTNCWRYITTGYVCGLPHELAKPIWLKGTLCKKENDRCSYPSIYNCKCSTKVCWIRLRRWICITEKRTNKSRFFLVTLYYRRPCGCDCRGRRRFIHPTPTIYAPPPTHYPWGPFPFNNQHADIIE